MIWVVLIVGAVIAIPLINEYNRRDMDDAARGKAPGQFADLPQGVTHFTWVGPERGPILVCIHGLTTPSFVWRGMIKGLALMGFRVLLYDLYGRGFSARPRGVQDRAFFLRQLTDLLTHQEIRTPVTLMGYSMGGAIAACFAAAQPDRVRQLVLLAPAGMQHAISKEIAFIRDWRGIGDWLMLAFYPRTQRKGIDAERHLASSVLNICDMQEAELDFKRYIPAVLSSLRGILSEDLKDTHQTIAQAGIPTLAIWGRDDTVIPLGALGTLTEWNRDAEQEVIDGAGHGLAYTHTDKVLAVLADRMIR